MGGIYNPSTYPVAVGGSRREYPNLALAVATETETVQADVTQAGTGIGVIVGSAAISAVDQFYRDQYVVLTDATPGNGLVYRTARVTNYVGATRTLTLDESVNFGVGENYEIIQPARVNLLQDVTENVPIDRSVIIELNGNRIIGDINHGNGDFVWIRNGTITRGFSSSAPAYVRLTGLDISARSPTIYSVFFDAGGLRGRAELKDCNFHGCVSARRGMFGWAIRDCQSRGLEDASVSNVPYRLFESMPGDPVLAITSADVTIDSAWSGAVFYSQNSLIHAGAGAYASIIACIRPPDSWINSGTAAKRIALARIVGAGSMVFTVNSGTIQFDVRAQGMTTFNVEDVDGTYRTNFAQLALQEFTGAASTLNITGIMVSYEIASRGAVAVVAIEGAATTTGTATVSGVASAWSCTAPYPLEPGSVMIVYFAGVFSGTLNISQSMTYILTGIGGSHLDDDGSTTQSIAGGTVNISSTITVYGTWRIVSVGFSASQGTYNVTGSTRCMGMTGTAIVDSFGLSGAATVAISGVIGYTFTQSLPTGATAIGFFRQGGTGTITVSSAIIDINGGVRPPGTHSVALQSGAGGSLVVSGPVSVRNCRMLAAVRVAHASAAGIARVTGTVLYEDCAFVGAFVEIEAVVGGTAEGPPSLTFRRCTFESTFAPTTGAGVLTLAAATLRFAHCHIGDVVTINGANYATVEAFLTQFDGSNLTFSVTNIGARPPTLYRYWKCSFRALFHQTFPDVLDDWTVLPAAPAFLISGQLLAIDAAGQAILALAGSVVEGIVLDSTAGVGAATIMVRRGMIFVDSNAAVVAGNNTILDVATPTQQIAGAPVPGQRIGRAMEPTGATRAGEAYTVVDLR